MKVFWLDRARVREALDALVRARYQPDPNVLAVYLFGSFARGDAVPGSDVDLLVVLDRDERPPRERIPDYLPGAFPVGVDVIPWTRAEWEARLAHGDRLARTVLAEGEVLLDRQGPREVSSDRPQDGTRPKQPGQGNPRQRSDHPE